MARNEERWLNDLGNEIQDGYDPLRDPLVDIKYEEICAERILRTQKRVSAEPQLSGAIDDEWSYFRSQSGRPE